jgi:exodeoxyribonuclease VII large subunit
MSVAVLARRLKGAVEGAFPEPFWVSGEVSDARPQAAGHLYFTLKDESANASLDAVIYKIDVAPGVRELVRNGARLVVLARVAMWVPRGRLQIVIQRVTAAGKGTLLEAIEKLKQKLAEEGLFAKERKRPLPADPRIIGVVTSAKGAVIHDIVQVAERRGGANILLCPATVQGRGAAQSIAWALEMLARVPEVDVIIVGRGGGSADDLMAYNDEHVVRAVAACRVPVVSAVGHELDVTLVDFAADARAATPSQAAEMIVPDRASRKAMLAQWHARLVRAIRAHIAQDSARSHEIGTRLVRLHPGAVLAERQARVARAHDRMIAAIQARLARDRTELGRSAARLDAMSPLAVLARGYAIATKDGRAVRHASDVSPGDVIDVRVHAARIEADVKRVVVAAPAGHQSLVGGEDE